MTDDSIQLLCAAIVALCQVYAMQPQAPLFATLWDFLATVCGKLANLLARMSLVYRTYYFEAISAYGNG
jgi:spore maturation protein SpmA